ncbi:hypothetical protein GH733_014787, partial [Mirounga leonina]
MDCLDIQKCLEVSVSDHMYRMAVMALVPKTKYVKQLDQSEMILQISEYEGLENKPGRLYKFYNSTAGKFSHPKLVQLVSELEAKRNTNIVATT